MQSISVIMNDEKELRQASARSEQWAAPVTLARSARTVARTRRIDRLGPVSNDTDVMYCFDDIALLINRL